MKPWKKISETPEKVGRRNLLRRTFIRPDGQETEFVVLDGGEPVCILALTDDKHVVLARQFRAGPEEVLSELPGGFPEEGESSVEAARRELLEETGYAGEMVQIGEHVESAYDTRRTQDFVATGCKKISEPEPDEEEYIEVVLVPLDEFREHLRRGLLSDIETGYLGLDYLSLL